MLNFKEIEKEISDFWKKNKTYETLMKRKGKSYFLLDGPPYANGIPHTGHIKNTVFKDLLIRLNFMKGFNVLFQPGFDTHGLPIENKVEKELNLGSKKDIEKFGIANFMNECKKNAAVNKDIWMDVYEKLGSLYFLKEPYLTYDNSYLESAWWAFKEMYKKGLVYEGEKPVMWCSHCETSLAGYEVTDSYKDVTDPGIYALFKLKDSDEHLLVYTTTPWTLPANAAVAVAPKEDYVKIDVAGKKIILAEKRLEVISQMEMGYTIIEKIKGESLVGKKYEPLLLCPLQKELSEGKHGKSHEVIASIPLLKERVASKIRTKKEVSGKDLFEEFVTVDTGTGVVHVAPGHGKTDNFVGQKYNLACVSPVNEQGELIEKLTGFSGFVKKADKEILKKLKDEGKLLYHESITHSYPLCWRCKSPLIFRLSKQLFFKIEKIKPVIEKENKKVAWYPEFARERFNNWVKDAEDWNISRQRYWGIPIPLWKCECGQEKVIGNAKELEELSGKKIKDLHSVEEIKIKCECGKDMNKIKGILDVWFDSGVAPWASMGYPAKNKELFEKHFPVTRIHEAQDQIRGWFYSLMFSSIGVFNKAPYKEVSMTGWVVDKKGQKMSKSLGNVVTGHKAIEDLGADILRFYFCWDVAPSEVQKFNLEIAKKEIGRLLNVLWNLQNLVSTDKMEKLSIEDTDNSGNNTKVSPKFSVSSIPKQSGTIMGIEDRWIISRMNSVEKEYNEHLNTFELNTGTRKLADFILNDLSRNYIRMTRDKNNSAVITNCFVKVLKLLAPITPFITEKIWQNLRDKKIVSEESIHLASWPDFEKQKIDSRLENQFEIVFNIIEAGLRQRDKSQMGLKWPLAKATIFGKDLTLGKELENIIAAQLNVKKVEFENSNSEIEVSLDTILTPELEAEGYAREVSRLVQSFRKKLGLNKSDEIKLFIFADENFTKILGKNKEFIKERTNSESLSFLSDDKKNFKNRFEFKVKDKEGVIFIEK